MQYMKCVHNQGNEASLNLGVIYRALPTTALEAESGMVRIVDNEGEDYLYPRRWFEPVAEQALAAELTESLTVHLNSRAKIALRDMAHAKGIPMSVLLREWIDERLDLPELAEYA